jgi:hypothetical protein
VPSRDAAGSFEVFCFFFFEEKKLEIIVMFMKLVVPIENDYK